MYNHNSYKSKTRKKTREEVLSIYVRYLFKLKNSIVLNFLAYNIMHIDKTSNNNNTSIVT